MKTKFFRMMMCLMAIVMAFSSVFASVAPAQSASRIQVLAVQSEGNNALPSETAVMLAMLPEPGFDYVIFYDDFRLSVCDLSQAATFADRGAAMDTWTQEYGKIRSRKGTHHHTLWDQIANLPEELGLNLAHVDLYWLPAADLNEEDHWESILPTVSLLTACGGSLRLFASAYVPQLSQSLSTFANVTITEAADAAYDVPDLLLTEAGYYHVSDEAAKAMMRRNEVQPASALPGQSVVIDRSADYQLVGSTYQYGAIAVGVTDEAQPNMAVIPVGSGNGLLVPATTPAPAPVPGDSHEPDDSEPTVTIAPVQSDAPAPSTAAPSTSKPENNDNSATAKPDAGATTAPAAPEDNGAAQPPAAPEDNGAAQPPSAPEDNGAAPPPAAPEDNGAAPPPASSDDNGGAKAPEASDSNDAAPAAPADPASNDTAPAAPADPASNDTAPAAPADPASNDTAPAAPAANDAPEQAAPPAADSEADVAGHTGVPAGLTVRRSSEAAPQPTPDPLDELLTPIVSGHQFCWYWKPEPTLQVSMKVDPSTVPFSLSETLTVTLTLESASETETAQLCQVNLLDNSTYELSAVLRNPAGREEALTLTATEQPGVYQTTFQRPSTGMYTIRATIARKDIPFAYPVVTTLLTVEAPAPISAVDKAETVRLVFEPLLWHSGETAVTLRMADYFTGSYTPVECRSYNNEVVELAQSGDTFTITALKDGQTQLFLMARDGETSVVVPVEITNGTLLVLIEGGAALIVLLLVLYTVFFTRSKQPRFRKGEVLSVVMDDGEASTLPLKSYRSGGVTLWRALVLSGKAADCKENSAQLKRIAFIPKRDSIIIKRDKDVEAMITGQSKQVSCGSHTFTVTLEATEPNA